MANENIVSLKDAEAKISELKNQIANYETQIKELQSRSLTFVDNPNHILNKEISLAKSNVMYIPTNDKNRHYSMKVEDMDKHFDPIHYPLYFHDEVSCSVFDSIFPILNDLIKFKTLYDPSTNINPSASNPVYLVYLNTTTNVFETELVKDKCVPTVYFGYKDIAENCCTWLNYKYGLGKYHK